MLSQEYPIEKLERLILRTLFAHANGEAYTQLAGALAGYSWRDEEHRVIFEAMRRLRSLPPTMRGRELASEATRMGFPDVDCSDYLEGESATLDEIPELIQRIRALTQ